MLHVDRKLANEALVVLWNLHDVEHLESEPNVAIGLLFARLQLGEIIVFFKKRVCSLLIGLAIHLVELVDKQLSLNGIEDICLSAETHVVLNSLNTVITVCVSLQLQSWCTLLTGKLNGICVGCLVYLGALVLNRFFFWLFRGHELLVLDHETVIVELCDLLDLLLLVFTTLPAEVAKSAHEVNISSLGLLLVKRVAFFDDLDRW